MKNAKDNNYKYFSLRGDGQCWYDNSYGKHGPKKNCKRIDVKLRGGSKCSNAIYKVEGSTI